MHHFDNFPPASGAARITSYLNFNGRTLLDPKDEQVDSEAHNYFALNDKSIITIIDLPAENACRIIIRDVTGKYGWDICSFFDDINDLEIRNSEPPAEIERSPTAKWIHTGYIGAMASLKTLSSSQKSLYREMDPLETLLSK